MRKRLFCLGIITFLICMLFAGGTMAYSYTQENYTSAIVREENSFKGEYFRQLVFSVVNENGINIGDTVVDIQQNYVDVRKMARTRNSYGTYEGAVEVYASAYIRNKWGTSADFVENTTPLNETPGYICEAIAKLDLVSFNVKETSHVSHLRRGGTQYDNFVMISYK